MTASVALVSFRLEELLVSQLPVPGANKIINTRRAAGVDGVSHLLARSMPSSSFIIFSPCFPSSFFTQLTPHQGRSADFTPPYNASAYITYKPVISPGSFLA